MAMATISKPGTGFGPCNGPCKHRVCIEARKIADQVCRICGDVIGFEKQFIIESRPEILYLHTACSKKIYMED